MRADTSLWSSEADPVISDLQTTLLLRLHTCSACPCMICDLPGYRTADLGTSDELIPAWFNPLTARSGDTTVHGYQPVETPASRRSEQVLLLYTSRLLWISFSAGQRCKHRHAHR